MATPRDRGGRFEKSQVKAGTLKERSADQQGEGVNGHSNGRFLLPDQQVGPYVWGQSMLSANGGSWANPMGFPNYGTPLYGSPATYRWLLQLPPVRFVRSIRTNAIMASTSEAVPSRKGVPQSVVDACKEQIEHLRPNLMHDFLVRGMDYGWQGGELIWMLREGRYWIDRVKPLLVDATEVLRDDHGNFTGLRNTVKKEVKLSAPFKAWKYTYDGESGNHYGRSWLENIRATAVKDWLDCLQQLQRLGAKISGMVTIIMAPSGTFPGVDKDGNATTFTYKEAARQSIEGLARGAAGVYFPNVTLAADARGGLSILDAMKALYGKSLVSVDVKDFSGNSQAIQPVLDRMKHAEELIFNGGLRSARVGLEAEHGTKEEAGTHTDTGTVNAEVDDEDFARQLTSLMDAFLVANWGESMRGAVHVHAPSLVDRKTQLLKSILMALLNEPSFRVEYGKTANIDVINKVLDIPAQKVFDSSQLAVAKTPTGDPNLDPNPEGGRPANAPAKTKPKPKGSTTRTTGNRKRRYRYVAGSV